MPATLTPEASPSPRLRWLAIGMLVVATLVAYSNSLRAPFVYDDVPAIPDNPTIRHLWPLWPVVRPQAEGGLTVSGRPILNLSLAVNHAISGNSVWSYHVFNILVHAGAGLLLFGLVRRTLIRAGGTSPEDAIALAIAALWTLHPLQTQAVTYTVQRAESLMGFSLLLTLYAFVRATSHDPLEEKRARRAQVGWFALSVGACGLGMGTKEVMATAPLLVLLYDRTFVAGSFRAAWQRRRGYYPALGATWLVLAALVLSTGGNRGGTVGAGVGVPWWAYGLTQFQAIARYLALSFWPQPLVFEYGTFWVRRTAEIAPYAVVIIPLLAGTVVALWRRPAAGFLGAWFFLILAPTSLTPGTIQMIVEHRMYLPLAAVVTAVVITAHTWLGRRVFVGFAIIAAIFAGLTLRRNHDYRSHFALWSDTVAKRPGNPRAHEGLAEAYAELGRSKEAGKEHAETVRLAPDQSTYHYNLALNLAQAGRVDEAIRHYKLALQLTPDEPRMHNNLAVALVQAGQFAAALPHYAEAVRLKPNEAQFHYNHGVALLRLGRAAEALTEYEAALRVQPDYADAHFNLGTALVQLKRIDEALSHYTEALRLRPGEVDYRTTYGGVLLLAGRPNDALGQFRALLAAHPDAVEAMFGAGNALAALHRGNEAIAQYQAVLHRAPNHANAHFKLGNALIDADRVPEAVQHYEAAARLLPDDAEAHHNLGVAYARIERWTDAGREFETALRLQPDYADARRNLEQLRRLQGR